MIRPSTNPAQKALTLASLGETSMCFYCGMRENRTYVCLKGEVKVAHKPVDNSWFSKFNADVQKCFLQ